MENCLSSNRISSSVSHEVSVPETQGHTKECGGQGLSVPKYLCLRTTAFICPLLEIKCTVSSGLASLSGQQES